MALGHTAVDQGSLAGEWYPFTEPTILSDCVLDCYLVHDVYNNNYPFSIEITNIIGSDFDVLLKDNSNNILETFSSHVATVVDWGTNRKIFEWLVPNNDVVFRMVLVPSALTAGTGILCSRTIQDLPGRVRSIKVGNSVFKEDIIFEAGNNVSLAHLQNNQINTLRNRNRILIEGIPGAGEGFDNNCDDPNKLYVRTINKIRPDKNGNFFIQTDGCSFSSPVFNLVSPPDAPIPQFTITNGIMKLYDNCSVCCKCEYYVNVYKALSKVWQNWKDLADAIIEARDKVDDLIEQIKSIEDCLNQNAFTLQVTNNGNCRFTVQTGCCNRTKCCHTNIQLRLTFILYRNGSPLNTPPSPVTVENSYIYKPGGSSYENYSPAFFSPENKWPVAIFYYDTWRPNASFGALLKMKINCQPGDALQVYATVHMQVDDPAACGLTAPTVPSILTDIWNYHNIPYVPVWFIKETMIGL